MAFLIPNPLILSPFPTKALDPGPQIGWVTTLSETNFGMPQKFCGPRPGGSDSHIASCHITHACERNKEDHHIIGAGLIRSLTMGGPTHDYIVYYGRRTEGGPKEVRGGPKEDPSLLNSFIQNAERVYPCKGKPHPAANFLTSKRFISKGHFPLLRPHNYNCIHKGILAAEVEKFARFWGGRGAQRFTV